MNKLLIFGVAVIAIVAIGLFFAISANDTRVYEDTIEIYELNILRDGAAWELTGKTTDVEQEISFFYNPNWVLIFEYREFANSDGKFKSVMTTGDPHWRQAGNYTITAQQGEKLNPGDSRIFEMTEVVQGNLDFINKRTP